MPKKERESQSGGQTEAMRLVGELSRLFRGELRRACGENGVPLGYRGLLFHLGKEDGQTQKALAEKTGLKAATVSVTIEKMERDGYVARRRDGSDGRMMRVFLTEKGQEIDRKNKEKVDELEKQFSAVLTEEERSALAGLLHKVIEGYKAQSGKREGRDG